MKRLLCSLLGLLGLVALVKGRRRRVIWMRDDLRGRGEGRPAGIACVLCKRPVHGLPYCIDCFTFCIRNLPERRLVWNALEGLRDKVGHLHESSHHYQTAHQLPPTASPWPAPGCTL